MIAYDIGQRHVTRVLAVDKNLVLALAAVEIVGNATRARLQVMDEPGGQA